MAESTGCTCLPEQEQAELSARCDACRAEWTALHEQLQAEGFFDEPDLKHE